MAYRLSDAQQKAADETVEWVRKHNRTNFHTRKITDMSVYHRDGPAQASMMIGRITVDYNGVVTFNPQQG